jgi:hypothetical protein
MRRDIDQESLGRGEGRLARDADLHLAALHRPEYPVIGIEHGLGLFARGERDIVTLKIAGERHGQSPTLLALMRR